MAKSRHLTSYTSAASRGFLVLRVPLPKGMTPRKARRALKDHLGFEPERIIQEALKDAKP